MKAQLSSGQSEAIIERIKKTTDWMTPKKKADAQFYEMQGACIALDSIGYAVPIYWVINLECGRLDRVFNPAPAEVKCND